MLEQLSKEMFEIQADLTAVTQTLNEMKQAIAPVELAESEYKTKLQEVKDKIEVYIKEENGGAGETLNGFKYGLKKLPPHVVLKEGTTIPEKYLVVKTQPNKKLIGEALKDGEWLDFAEMSAPEFVLDIKADV